MGKAIFLDRDGVVNELVYYPEHGVVDSPFMPKQFRLLPGVAIAIRMFHEEGFKVLIASNQPGIAKGHFSYKTFDQIGENMKSELSKEGAFLDGEYYCLHHPEAKIEVLRINCECRKPKPGLLLQAAKDLDLDLSQSWMIGDGLIDVQTGKAAGCRTVLLGNMKCELCRLMAEQNARPSFIAPNLIEAAKRINRGLPDDEAGV